MANFNTHLITAASLSGLASTTLYGMGLVSANDAMLNFSLCTAGGLLPDLDSDNSVVLRIMFSVIALLAAFLAIFELSGKLFIAESMLLWLFVFLLIYVVGFNLFKRFTVHRGIFHSVPAGMLAGMLTSIVFFEMMYYEPLGAWLTGTFLFSGYLIHLLLDEIYSVDLSNHKIKRSFGSAFKFWAGDNIAGTLILYGLLLVCLLLTPPIQSFLDTFFNATFFAALLERLIPPDGWYNNFR